MLEKLSIMVSSIMALKVFVIAVLILNAIVQGDSGRPINVKATNITSTSIECHWDAPTTGTIPTSYLIFRGKCEDKTCSLHEYGRSTKTAITITGLEPYSLYLIHICSYVNGNKGLCNEDQNLTRTEEGLPGSFESFKLSKSLVEERHVITFGKIKYMGSPLIQVNVECDDGKLTKATKIFNETAMTTQNHMNISKICADTVKCIIYANNSYGKGTPRVKILDVNDDCIPDEEGTNVVAVVVPVVLVIILVLVIAGGYLWWWKKKQDKLEQKWLLQLERANNLFNEMPQSFRPRNLYVDAMEVEAQIERSFQPGFDAEDEEEMEYFTNDNYDYEFPRDQLNILQKLGEGNFAWVYKAEAIDIAGRPGVSFVATKILKDSADDKDRNDFMDELDLMKQIKPHTNVVRLLGCCTRKGDVVTIVEFLPAGDLLDYLRKSKRFATENGVSSNLTENDFLKFAYDIVSGMVHLAEHKIVHRDLACRNVLVGANRRCKIADLGLARFLNDEGIYYREKEAKLPLKWTAPESLFYGHSTSKSDVWSFGIVFWEIVTVGGTPYPENKSREVIKLLKEKYRMDQPEHCSDELFSIMTDCWDEAYESRPTFQMLQSRLKSFTENDESYMRFDCFQEDLYISFDDADAEMSMADITRDNGTHHANDAFKSDNKNNTDVKYNANTDSTDLNLV